MLFGVFCCVFRKSLSLLIALSGISITPSGISIEIKELQPKNALGPISSKVVGSVTVSNLVHPLKALSSISVTPSGISIEIKELQPKNAFAPICFKDVGKVTVSNLVHPLNAQSIGTGIFLSF